MTKEKLYVAFTKYGYINGLGYFTPNYKEADRFTTPFEAKDSCRFCNVKCSKVRAIIYEDDYNIKLLGFFATFIAMLRLCPILNIFYKKRYAVFDNCSYSYIQDGARAQGDGLIYTALLYTPYVMHTRPIYATDFEYKPVKVFLNGNIVDQVVEKRIKHLRKFYKNSHLQRHNLNF